jgi:hypothetical protein
MLKGDIVYCDFPSFGDKPNRPAIILDVTETSVYCLRITHNASKSSYELPTDLRGIIECCTAITGFIYLNPTSILKGLCRISHCSQCKISLGLKIILIRYGIKF